MTTPALITIETHDDMLNRMVARIQASITEAGHTWDANLADPLRVALSQVLVDELRTAFTQVNVTGPQRTFTYATGQNLTDFLGPSFLRSSPTETDEAYKARYVAYLHSLSGRTNLNVFFRVRASSSDVSDVSLIRGTGYATDVFVQGPDFARSTPALRALVKGALDSTGELYATYTVLPETRVLYDVSGDILTTAVANNEVIARAVDTKLRREMAARARFNTGVYASDLQAAVWTEGMANITLTVSRRTVSKGSITKTTNTTLAANQVRRTGASTLELRTSDFDVRLGDNVKLSVTGASFTGTNVTKAEYNASGNLDLTFTSVAFTGTWNAGNWAARTDTGITVEVSRAAGNLDALANVVHVGGVGTSWRVWNAGTSRPTTGGALVP